MRSAIVLAMVAGMSGLLQCGKSKSVSNQTSNSESQGQTLPAAARANASAAGTGASAPGAGTMNGPACAPFNNGGPCTPTEQRFVDKSGDCYQCMVNAGCLDSGKFKDTGHECGDVAGNAAAGPAAGTSRVELCLNTLDCILSTRCASADVAICYCGSLGGGNGCAVAPVGAPNGKCLDQELAGLEFAASTLPYKLLPSFNDLGRGAGMANQLFNCAKSNNCDKLCAR